MDLQYWLYIIIGVIYLLNQFRKKPEQQQTDFPPPKPERPEKRFELPDAKPPAQRPLTFEELLREITEGKTPQHPAPVIPEKKGYVDYDDNIPEEAQDLEEVSYDDRRKDKAHNIYEEAKRQAFLRPSLEETLKLSDTDVTFGKFKAFEQKQQRNLINDYLTSFRDPEGLKKAVVMSEILKPKF